MKIVTPMLAALTIVLTLPLALFSFLLPQSLQLQKTQQTLQNLSPSPAEVAHIPFEIYQQLHVYAHLIDISYCVSNANRISSPFNCDLGCSKAFPNTTLLYQWYFDDTVAGYIAITDHLLFGNSSTPKKSLIISLRGTRSAPDTYADLNIEMTQYSNINQNLPQCATCKVHEGFYNYYLSTRTKINPVIEKVISEEGEENLQILIMGHSLGGAVALLLSLHYLDLGYPDVKLVTMGQPLVGNKQFTNWADMHLGSYDALSDRLFWRVIHKGDVVPTLPNKHLNIGGGLWGHWGHWGHWDTQGHSLLSPGKKKWFEGFPPFFRPQPPIDLQPDSYQQFDNQIYINCSSHKYNPIQSEVVDCFTGSNEYCIKGDLPPILNPDQVSVETVSYDSHLAYFRKMGFCGVRI